MVAAPRLAWVLGVLLFAGGARAAEPSPLTEIGRARELCLALRPAERVAFPGGPAERAQARERFEAERTRLRESSFAVELPWTDFTVVDWNGAEATVRVGAERPFRALGGALSLFDLERTELELGAVPGAEAALVEGLRKGSLTLALSFQPAEEDPCPCTVSKLGEISFSVDLLAAELRADSLPVARAVGEGLAPFARAQPAPKVELRAADLIDGKPPEALLESFRAQLPALRDCHAKGLARVASLEGSLVVETRTDETGRLVASTLVADSLQDAEVGACVLVVLKAARAPKSVKGTVVIELGSEPDGATAAKPEQLAAPTEAAPPGSETAPAAPAGPIDAAAPPEKAPPAK